VTTDRLTLRGLGAVLEPASTPTHNACLDPTSPADVNGICVLGDVNFDTGEVNRPVNDVTVTGFTIRGFSDSGIIAVGAGNATFSNNVAEDNDEYGIRAFTSSGTRMLFNRVSGANEVGFYIGDSPNADATLVGNESFDSLFGVLIRNALQGSVVANSLHDNCVVVAVLADAPGPAGLFNVTANRITTTRSRVRQATISRPTCRESASRFSEQRE
jgi:parallel beta-helix repeat protein